MSTNVEGQSVSPNDAKPNVSSSLSMREIAEQLWSLLDNIDTLSDICKPTVNDPKAAMAFYNNAMKYAAKRFELLKSDGYKIYTNEEFEALPKPESSFAFLDKDEYKEEKRNAVKIIIMKIKELLFGKNDWEEVWRKSATFTIKDPYSDYKRYEEYVFSIDFSPSRYKYRLWTHKFPNYEKNEVYIEAIHTYMLMNAKLVV